MILDGVNARILRYFAECGSFGADYVKVVEDRHDIYCLRQKCSPKNLVFRNISFMAILVEVTENECIIERHPRDIEPLRNSLISLICVGVFSV